ncbi:MAG: carboxymuconolactone decarboxylase family protein [Proteobacteria bacterium]|nr:MAG: carboxymuconolactone decarboxylase family protein [Pseudomonadota bacterium]
MQERANYQKLATMSVQALKALDQTLETSPLGRTIIDLVKVRASQLNGDLFSLDLHSKEAKNHGEREIRLYHLTLWRESRLFTDRERAALEWTEILTHPDAVGAEEEDYELLSEEFSEKEIVDLTLVISSINAWNRLGIAFRPVPGSLDRVMGLDKLDK